MNRSLTSLATGATAPVRTVGAAVTMLCAGRRMRGAVTADVR